MLPLILCTVRLVATFTCTIIIMVIGMDRGWSGKKMMMWSLALSIPVDYIDSIQGRNYTLTSTYKRWDKVTDTLAYGMILFMYMLYDPSDVVYTSLLFVTYIYRLVGVILYLRTLDGMSLVLFPNLFVEPMIVMSFISEYTNISGTGLILIMLMSVAAKVGYEWLLHMWWNVPS